MDNIEQLSIVSGKYKLIISYVNHKTRWLSKAFAMLADSLWNSWIIDIHNFFLVIFFHSDGPSLDQHPQ